ncbi:MAG: alpha-glucan family phosphorylase [Marinobacter sp.]|nr:alpha-glucan family phosphorylase [Marinobacter sp.]
MHPATFTLEARPILPASLQRLEELANNLLYSWDHSVRHIFYRLDLPLWQQVGHNPKVFLRRISQDKLDQAAQDRTYLADLNRVLSSFDAYMASEPDPEVSAALKSEQDLVAYFCAEFGFHESFPIYSGGLGILAGDHCKAASDLGVPFVAVGLLYQQGYFIQQIDAQGHQIALYHSLNSDELPVAPILKDDGAPLCIALPFPGRELVVQVWEAYAGHTRLLLLDAAVTGNQPEDQAITQQLYGGDQETRIQQELVLGIGGTRALRALGYQPTAWHINEGHAAFLILERCRELVEQGQDFATALELVAAGTLFTTHTPVEAGHDKFPLPLVKKYLESFAQSLGITFESLFELGICNGGDQFNMTRLGLKGSRFHNGVSRIHGGIASEMEREVWPQLRPEDNPMDYITNGVHVPTFLAPEWGQLFDIQAPGWRSALRDPNYWQFVDAIPDYQYWSTHKALKQQMFDFVQRRLQRQNRRNGASESINERMCQALDCPEQDILVIGFARRFATYKRATLLFADLDRLERLVNDSERPILIIFAGKAHPKDKPGQQLIQVIHDLALRPGFMGRLLLLEDYDQAMARRLLAGVDVWLNTPEYPKEASGTSGEKAGMNGALNLSVLDGWWGEGFDGQNGWGIVPRGLKHDQEFRNREEARDLLDALEYQVIPLYYDRTGKDYSKGWIQRSKAAMRTILPRFNAQRMVMDYVNKFYCPASAQQRLLLADNARRGQQLARWKDHVRQHWQGVHLRLPAPLPSRCQHGEPFEVTVEAQLHGLSADDVRVECLFQQGNGDKSTHQQVVDLKPGDQQGDWVPFSASFTPPFAGLQHLQIRIYPWHPDLAHPFELGLMRWVLD